MTAAVCSGTGKTLSLTCFSGDTTFVTDVTNNYKSTEIVDFIVKKFYDNVRV